MRQLTPLLAVLVVGCPDPEPPKAAPKPAPKIDWAKAAQIDIGYEAEKKAVVARLRIAPGFHAYTTGETTGRPLKLDVKPPWTASAVQYPKGIEKNLPIGRSVIVEGRAEVVAPVTAPETAAPLTGTLQYQICTDDLCDRPRKKPFELSPEP